MEDVAQDNTSRVFEIDAQSNMIRILSEIPDYDPRPRAWYQAAAQAALAEDFEYGTIVRLVQEATERDADRVDL